MAGFFCGRAGINYVSYFFFLPLIWWFISFVGFYHFVHSTFFLSNLKHFISLMLLFFILFLSCSPHRLTNSEFWISNFQKFQNQSDNLPRNIEIFRIGYFVKPCGEQIIRNLFSTFMHILLSICLALDLLSSKSQIWNRGCSISKSTMQSSISKWDHKFINSKEPSLK